MADSAASGDEFECDPIDLGVPPSLDAERELEMEREVLGSSVRQWAANETRSAACKHESASFSRTVCACGSMHDYCDACGEALDCPLDAAPAAITRECSKCGGRDIAISWHGKGGSYECGYFAKVKLYGEHLHATCRTCQYEWGEDTLDNLG